MNPAHLGLIVAALPSERATWKILLLYLAKHSVAGIFFGSIRSIWRGGPRRPPLDLSDRKVKDSVQALRNLRLIRVVPAEEGSPVPSQIHVMIGMHSRHVEELSFALRRPSSWKDRRAAQRLWDCLERRRSTDGRWWSNVGPRFLGQKMESADLLADEFLGQGVLFDVNEPEPKSFPGVGNDFVDPTKSFPGVGNDLGGGERLPASAMGTTSPSEPVSVSSALLKPLSTGNSGGTFSGSKEVIEMGLRPERGDRVKAATERMEKNTAEGHVFKGSQLKDKPKKAPRKETRAKSGTTRQQVLRDWFAWAAVKPLLELYYGKGCIVTIPVRPDQAEPGSAEEPQELVEMKADVDLKASNPDAVRMVELLNGTKAFLFGSQAIEVPKNALKAWIAYARLFNMGYAGKDDQRAIPYLRTLLRRVVAKQQRVLPDQILPRMGGFFFRMDHMRKNDKAQFYSNPEWAEIYDVGNPRYLTAWADALLCGIKDPFLYMQSLQPFVETTADDGSKIVPPEPTKAERLAEIREELADRWAYCKESYDQTHPKGSWDKLTEAEQMDRAIGIGQWIEMKRLEKEIEGDPAQEAVRSE